MSTLPKYEYKIVYDTSKTLQITLDHLGEMGWELVTVIEGGWSGTITLYLKRPKR